MLPYPQTLSVQAADMVSQANLPFAASLHQLPLKLHATHTSECQVFLSCRAPCGSRSFYSCMIIQNLYAYNSIAILDQIKTFDLNISCMIASKLNSGLLVATKDESELSHGQTVPWTCPTCCLRFKTSQQQHTNKLGM